MATFVICLFTAFLPNCLNETASSARAAARTRPAEVTSRPSKQLRVSNGTKTPALGQSRQTRQESTWPPLPVTNRARCASAALPLPPASHQAALPRNPPPRRSERSRAAPPPASASVLLLWPTTVQSHPRLTSSAEIRR